MQIKYELQHYSIIYIFNTDQNLVFFNITFMIINQLCNFYLEVTKIHLPSCRYNFIIISIYISIKFSIIQSYIIYEILLVRYYYYYYYVKTIAK